MEVHKEYTINFSRQEIEKIAEIVGYIYSLHNEFNDATCGIEYSECSLDLQELDDCLDRAKIALSEYYNVIIDHCKS